jgi:hypothetical protein
MDEVDLPEVGLRRVTADARSVPDRAAAVRVAVDAQTGQQQDARPVLLAERVGGSSG